MKADIVILTPIAPEYEAVRLHLHKVKTVKQLPYLCQIGKFQGKNASYKIAICETTSGNLPVALAAKDCIQFFRPDYIFLTGTSGGIKQFNIGDIIIGKIGYDYEAGKEYDDGFKARPKVAYSDKNLVALAQKVGQKDDWKSRIKYPVPTKDIHIKAGAIASGSKVLATLNSKVLDIIKTHYNDTLAIEMEAYGFLNTLSDYPNIATINIRSISDLLSDKQIANLNHSKEIASANAAAFTFEVIYNLKKKKAMIPFSWLFLLVPLFLSFLVYKKWFIPEKPLVFQDAETILTPKEPKDTTTKIETVTTPIFQNEKKVKKSRPQRLTVDPPFVQSPKVVTTEEQLFRVDIFADIEATQYIIKNDKNEIVKKSQGHKIFNFPKGSYTITFFHQHDTSEYFVNIPYEKTVILEF